MASSLDVLDRLDFAPQDGLEEDQFLGNLLSGITSLFGETEDEFPGLNAFAPDPLEEAVFGENAVSAESQEAAMMMELLMDQLAESEGESEADNFLPVLAALAPLAMKALPAIAKVAAPVARKILPQLGRGILNVGRQVMRSPQTRQLVRTLPTIARNTAADALKTYSTTGQISGDTVKRSLARNVSDVLRVPAQRNRVVRRNRMICGRYFPQMIRAS